MYICVDIVLFKDILILRYSWIFRFFTGLFIGVFISELGFWD